MNKRVERLLDRISEWPDAALAELAESIAEIETRHLGVYRLSDDERAAVQRGLEELRAGKLATEEEVAKVFDRFR
jgi:predicted transcriptional regulator